MNHGYFPSYWTYPGAQPGAVPQPMTQEQWKEIAAYLDALTRQVKTLEGRMDELEAKVEQLKNIDPSVPFR